MSYTEEQKELIEIARKFIEEGTPRKEYLTISGLPGCGKTYIISKLQEELGVKCIYAVRTGKAATVLQAKGIPCVTIHHLAYDIVNSDNLTFKKKEELEENCDVFIIDEFSTVDMDMMNDLLAFGIPMIIVGDANQLPAIGTPTRYLQNPDFTLTHIVRQKEGSFIVKLARYILKGKLPKPGVYGEDGNRVIVMNREDLRYDVLMYYDQIICGKNETRLLLNEKIRRRAGFVDYLPEKGEKVIITKNCWNIYVGGLPLINGTTGTVVKVKDTPEDYFIMQFKPDYTEESKVLRVNKANFLGGRTKKNQEYATCEFGYAITVHKAQGSEYKKVAFIADKMPEMIKFLNTGITRAEEELLLVLP